MTEPLVVHVNRRDHHSIEPASGAVAVDGPAEVVLVNHGDGCHVNLSLTGLPDGVGSIPESNPYLDAGEQVRLTIDLPATLPGNGGGLELATGYGREQTTVSLRQATGDEGATAGGSGTGAAAAGSSATGTERATGEDDGSATTATGSRADGRAEGVGSGGDHDAAGDATDGAPPDLASRLRPDAWTVLLLCLAAVALGAAWFATRLLEGPAGIAGAGVVVATLVGVVLYLLSQGR